MSAQTKVSGTWKNMTAPYIKVSGSWKIAKSAWIKLDDNKWRNWFLQGGLNDAGFNELDSYGTFDALVSTLAIQSDGKIVIGGDFTTFNNTVVNRIARLNADGSLDTEFTTNGGTGANGSVISIAIQSDGKIVIVGSFTTFNGATVNRILRLNADGTRDTEFTTNTGTGIGGLDVRNLAIQSDGKIVVVGSLTGFNGVAANRIARLNADGTRDTAFTTNGGTGANSTVQSLAIQPDGKIVIGGFFTTFNGTTAVRIARLNADGSLDTEFTTNTGTGVNNFIRAIAIQSDGKIVITGAFTTFNEATVNRILRLNADGTRDTEFTTNGGTGANGQVVSIAIQSDGKIVVVGSFTTFNGATVNRILRLNADGTRDTEFTTNSGTGASFSVESLAIQSDGKIVIGGDFTTFNGVAVNFIARLNADGSLADIPAENFLGVNARVRKVAIQPDGKIIIGGEFTTFNGATANRIARLNSNGTLDTEFTTNTGTGASSTVNSIAIQTDGKILLGGIFTTFNGATVNRIARLNADGSLDTAFTTNGGTGANNGFLALAIQSDGKIVVGGFFTTFNGATVNRILRLNADGTRDTAFTTNSGTGASFDVESIAIQSDGKIVIGGFFTTFNNTAVNRIARLNADGSLDTEFTTNTGTGVNNFIRAIAIQSDGKIVIGGAFTTFNGATVNRIARLNADGSLDTEFTTNGGTGANNSIISSNVNSIAIQSDGKIVIGGTFATFNGATVNRIARLNADGSLDTAFATNTGTGATGVGVLDISTNTIAIQSDGKIVVGGNFTVFSQKIRTRLARIGGDIA